MDRVPKDVMRMIFEITLCTSDIFCWCVQIRYIRSVSRNWHAICCAHFNHKKCLRIGGCIVQSVIPKIVRYHHPQAMSHIDLLLLWNLPTCSFLPNAIEFNHNDIIKRALSHENCSLMNSGALTMIISHNNIEALEILKEYFCAFGKRTRDDVILDLLYAGKTEMLRIMVATFYNGDPYGLLHIPVSDVYRRVTLQMANNNPALVHPATEYLKHLKRRVLEQYIYDLYIHGYPETALGLMTSTQVYDSRICTEPKGNHKAWTKITRTAFHERIINVGLCGCKKRKKQKI